MKVDINTKMITLLGTPLGQSFAARMQNAGYEAADLNMLYFYTETDQEHLGDIVNGIRYMNFAGFAVTKPNKVRVLEYLDELDPLCKKMGATRTVNVAREKLEDIFREQNMVEGFDVGLEMSGSPAALNSMIATMRNGGNIALLGIQPPGTVLDFNQIIFKGLTLQGIYGRKMYETWYKMMTMVEGGLDVTPIITHRFHYTEFEKGFEAMNSGMSGKVVLDWTKK